MSQRSRFLPILFLILACGMIVQNFSDEVPRMSFNQLTPEEERIIVQRGTEPPGSGRFLNHHERGVYLCRRCDAPLYQSRDKFDSRCGWPAFDDEIPDAVKRLPDPDGQRVEIRCRRCDGHLGHLFEGERLTAKNTRHCVNSLLMSFLPAKRALFASGCFWGTEYMFKKHPGVISTSVGFTGGGVKNPTYQQVCAGDTGHVEAVEVLYDPTQTEFEALAKLFFETHDFNQADGQGSDRGPQYLSVLFVADETEREIAENLIRQLRSKGHRVATRVEKITELYPAEGYHQDYYEKTGKKPYCHAYRKVF